MVTTLPRAPLAVTADLRCELDGRPLSIFTEGQKIVVDSGDVFDFVKILRLAGASSSLRSNAKAVKASLDAATLHIESRVNGKVVGRIGFDVGSPFWRMFGLPSLQLRLLAIVSNVFSRSRMK